MKKKGFSLVEMLAVVTILGVLALMITPAIVAIRNNLLENTLDTKISAINDAAKDYANKHLMDIPSYVSSEYLGDKNSTTDCLTIYVRTLINGGYILGDSNDRMDLMNPVTEESLNNEMICIRFNNNDALNREVVTYIVGEKKLYED